VKTTAGAACGERVGVDRGGGEDKDERGGACGGYYSLFVAVKVPTKGFVLILSDGIKGSMILLGQLQA